MTGDERKQALLDELRAARRDWDALLAPMTEADMLTPGVVGDWTIKDLAAHLMYWESRPVKWLEAARKGTTPEPSPTPKNLSEDEVNAWIYERYRNHALNDVLSESRAIHDAVVHGAAEMSAAALFEQKIEWLGGSALADALPGNTCEHYRDHAATVRQWWQKHQAG